MSSISAWALSEMNCGSSAVHSCCFVVRSVMVEVTLFNGDQP